MKYDDATPFRNSGSKPNNEGLAQMLQPPNEPTLDASFVIGHAAGVGDSHTAARQAALFDARIAVFAMARAREIAAAAS